MEVLLAGAMLARLRDPWSTCTDIPSGNSARPPQSLWPLDESDLRLFLGVGLFLLLTKLPSLVQLTYSPDDYFHTNTSRFTTTWMVRLFVAQGRFGQAALYAFLRELGLHPILASAPLALVAIGEWSLCAVLLARLWGFQGYTLLAVLVGGLVFSHPYFIDHWWFRYMPVFAATATLATLTGLWWAQTERRSWWLGAVAVCLGLSVFQIALNHCLVVILLGMLLDLVRRPNSTLRSIVDRWRRPAAVLVLGTGVYILAMHAVVRLLGVVPESRMQLVDVSDAPERLGQIGRLFSTMLLRDPLFDAPLLQASVLAILLSAAVLVAIRPGLDHRSPVRAIVGVGCWAPPV